uniref:Beta-hexosaminidase bacterial type N-terminal domain-containing protein n=1 Tax=Roseihalotalea indica TaxID=2867963 RepID=A0AA49GIY7_9BACT|nr:hypothetical protein K4G66_25380 [Tunicatimonas sp. TK19036]
MFKIFLFSTVLHFLTAGMIIAQNVSLLYNDSLPQAAYAARKLSEALTQQNFTVKDDHTGYDYLISLATHPVRLKPEAFAIVPEDKIITVYGGDNRGMIYGALALAETLRNGIPLEEIKASEESPDQEFRGIKYNLPWETYRPSSALDQHMETARNLDYWEAFLDMMVENRFNAISLWNMHPYTFMIQPKNFPEASPWTDEEFAEWQHWYREVFRMAKERALDTYIVHWSIFVSQEFAKAHDVATHNFYPYYYVPGDTTEIVRRYLRESVQQVLEEYPDLDGIGISHGEGMAGMTPLERQQWMDDVLIAGMLEVDRPVKLIHRVPFSSGLSSEGGTSKNVEVVTREAMEKLGNSFEGPIWVEMKFNWSHAHSTPKLVKVHGGKLGDTYFDPLPTNYKITWQARNEDFFALRWGVPDFIRQHIALNGKAAYAGGYFVGSETYIPALDYFTAVDDPVNWQWAFERQWLFYKLWGRLQYNPETPDSVFQAEFNRKYGDQGNNLLNAYSLASTTQLRLASLYDSRWDFTLYSEGFLALQGDTTRYISVNELINHPTMDPDYVSVSEYVKTIQKGGSFGVDRITPPILIEMLERDNQEALRLVEGIDTDKNASLMYEVADVKTWANLGLHLAEKLKGAVALQTYRTTGEEAQKQQAIEHLQKALGYWDEVVNITRPIYRDMRLTHYNHNAFEANDNNLFHWALIRDEVAQDVEIAKSE